MSETLKAILVTEENVEALGARFNNDVDEPIEAHWWLVLEFGNDETYDFISIEDFPNQYEIVNELRNGFVEIRERETKPPLNETEPE